MGFVPNLPATLMKNQEFVTDLARFAEGLESEAAVRKKWRLEESEWITLGENDELVRAIDEKRVQRVRNGSFKIEHSQQLITKAPAVLSGIMLDGSQSAKHRIDSAKVLNDFADPGPSRFAAEQDRVIIRIDLTAGGGEVVEFDKSIRPQPNDEVIDATPEELPPPRR